MLLRRRLEERLGNFRPDIERLRKTGIPGIPVHLPHVWELGNGSEYWYGKAGGMTDSQGTSLRESLEQALGAESVGLFPYLNKMRADPLAYTLSAADQHPNRLGIELYASAIASALKEKGILPTNP
jgi:hypothetical protein